MDFPGWVVTGSEVFLVWSAIVLPAMYFINTMRLDGLLLSSLSYYVLLLYAFKVNKGRVV